MVPVSVVPLLVAAVLAIPGSEGFVPIPCAYRSSPSTGRRDCSAWPAASSAKKASHGFSTETKMAATSTRPILEPQGNFYPWYSMSPLTEIGEFATARGLYFKRCKEANGGAAIFKFHPGLKMIAITDHASTKWFYNQPDTMLDRQDPSYFGPLKVSKDYIGESVPALLTSLKEGHPEVRAYMIEALREKAGGAQPAFTHASDKFYADLKAHGLGEYPEVYDFFLQQTHAIMLEWMLGTGEEGGQPLPPFKDFISVNPADLSVLMGAEIDTPVANAVLQTLTKLKGGGASSDQKASVQVLLDSITSSKAWPRLTEILEKNKTPITQLERSMMFSTGFQSSSAMATTMKCMIGALNLNPDFLKDLQDEVDGQDLTMAAVSDVSRFPLLDSLHWEILRMFPAPPFCCKVAKGDAVVPTSNGDRYQIRKGDTLFCHQALGQIDQLKFGADGREFNPRRFVGNQALKKDVFAFCYPDAADVTQKDGMPWGCVAHAIGVIDSMLLAFYGRWVQEYTWEMTEPSVIDQDLFLGTVGPDVMAFSKITPRK